MKFPNGNKKDCHKKRPKTRIFACLCPCSVLEYVDTDNSLKKKNGKHNESGFDAGKDSEMRNARNSESCEAGRDMDDFMDIPPLLKDNSDMPMGPSPCREAARPMRRPLNPMQGLPGRCPIRNTAGDTILTKPLKIVFEEVDCSALDFSACNKPPSAGDCAPCQPPPQQQCPASPQRQRCLPPALQRCLPPTNPCQAQCPMPKCPEPCQPPPSRPAPNQHCPPCPFPACPPPPPVTQRLEFRVDKMGQIVDKCIPIGSPSILNISRDGSCPSENTIKITYCGMGTDKGKKDDKQSQGDKSLEEKPPSDPSSKSKKSEDSAQSGLSEDKASKAPSTASEQSVGGDGAVAMALGPFLDKSEESLERIIGIRTSDLRLNLGCRPASKINVREEPRPLIIRPPSPTTPKLPADDLTKQLPLFKNTKPKFLYRQVVVKKDGSKDTAKERFQPKKPLAHRVLGLHREEFLQSTHQTRRVFGYTMKALTNSNSALRKLFKETSV